eukprot:m.161712 g.161712  ORF g.161712 m.161712 type:complete len:168 (-) comp16380_c0_seq4:137-640(-)
MLRVHCERGKSTVAVRPLARIAVEYTLTEQEADKAEEAQAEDKSDTIASESNEQSASAAWTLLDDAFPALANAPASMLLVAEDALLDANVGACISVSSPNDSLTLRLTIVDTDHKALLRALLPAEAHQKLARRFKENGVVLFKVGLTVPQVQWEKGHGEHTFLHLHM